MTMQDNEVHRLEERLAHALRVLDDLSDVIARQDRDISRLTILVDKLVLREAEREQDASGGVVLGDERPPHY